MGNHIEFLILNWIQTLRTPVGDGLMCFITKLGNAGIVWIALTVFLLLFRGTRKAGIVMLAALCIDLAVCNGILKNLAARIRPCDVNTQIQLLIARPDDFSFPSGHTAASFAAVAALYFSGKRNLWKAALVLACLIAFSRLYLYVHYPTDVLGGAVIGFLAGFAGNGLIQRSERWIKGHRA